MFYLPFELRNQTEYCTPKGPNFKSAPLKKFSVNGTYIQLRVPSHRTKLPTEPRHARQAYNLDKLHLDYCFTDKPQWRGLPILFRIWEFYGPWFTGRLGAISFSLTILRPNTTNDSVSFFHPRAFENALADYLTYYHGGSRTADQTAQALLAPVNWDPLVHLPCIGATFDAVENNKKMFLSGDMHRYMCFPISHHHFVCLTFHLTRNRFLPEKNEPRKDADDWINIAPMKALVDQVINSVTVTLSSEAQAQQQSALQGIDDKSLTREFPPMKWS